MASAVEEMKKAQAIYQRYVAAVEVVEHTAERMEELLAKMDEREQKLIAVENRVLRNMAALADLIGDPSETPDESPGKDPANVEERLRRNIDARPTLTVAPADTPTKKELKW